MWFGSLKMVWNYYQFSLTKHNTKCKKDYDRSSYYLSITKFRLSFGGVSLKGSGTYSRRVLTETL